MIHNGFVEMEGLVSHILAQKQFHLIEDNMLMIEILLKKIILVLRLAYMLQLIQDIIRVL